MQRVTLANLQNLTDTLCKTTGQAYEVGQLHGHRWLLIATASRDTLLNQPTKGALYDHMHSLLAGARHAQATATKGA
jgi:hypothetical protein